MRCHHVWNCQTICPNMVWLTFHYCFTFFSVHFYFQSVAFWKLAHNFIFQCYYCHYSSVVLIWLWGCLIILSGDLEVNQGPPKNYNECLSICLWNLNSISAHDYSKLFLWKTYNSFQIFDNTCLLKSYPDSIVPLDDDTLVLPRYNLVCF